MPVLRGRALPFDSSSGVMMCTAESDFAARASRDNLGWREYLGAVLERTRCRHDVAGRNGDGQLEIAVLEIELALAEIRLGVPPAQVVVDAYSRIPLCELEQRCRRGPSGLRRAREC